MAIVTERRQDWQPGETDRRVRHPLQALRGYIRMYVAIEGLMLAVIFLALWFWIGLVLDFGAFKAFPIRVEGDQYVFGGFDWIQSLQWMPPAGHNSADIVRIVLLSVLLVALLALVAFKVFLRLFVEFRDSALALVLERRFPEQLGDRLITAVELADPRLADRYGMSRAMIDKTILDAAERVEKTPVREVFNWPRLRLLTLAAFGFTVGLYLCLWGTFIGIAAAIGAADTPGDFFWRFNNVAGIWAERNLLVMDSYWPRQAHLEIVRFQDTPSHRDEMRIGRDDQRPDIHVRAVRWVIADRSSPDGWRSLRWRDLPALDDAELTRRMQAVDFPADWGSWVIDLNDLDGRVASGVIPLAWQGKTSGEIREGMKQAEFQNTLAGLQSQRQIIDQAINSLLDWQAWTVDKIELQEGKGEVRRAMRDSRPAAHKALQDVLARLEELAELLPMERTLRRLETPTSVEVHYRGKNTKLSTPYERLADNKFSIGLGDLKESVEFMVRGFDYWTRPRRIELVAPPGIVALKMDTEEPAYIYYRVQGDQQVLKGKKQLRKDVAISVSGESSIIPVPLGANLTLIAEADRPLRDGIILGKVDKARPGAGVPLIDVRLHGDRRTFSGVFTNVVRPFDFVFEFNDEDNVKGKRRVLIEPIDDKAPDVDLELDPSVVLRRPGQQKGARSGEADGLLVTPDALIPFKGMLRDDYALTDAKWDYQVKQVEVELAGKPSVRSTDEVALVVSGLQFNPINLTPAVAKGAYWTWLTSVLTANAAPVRPTDDYTTPLAIFMQRLQASNELPLTALDDRLSKKPQRRTMLDKHNVADEAGFDFRDYLPQLKVRDALKEAQQHYLVRMFVTATDNNVETGPSTSRSSKAISFLVVSENELLAQIFVEEETLRERLEKIIQQLQDGRTTLDEQITALSAPEPKLSLVAIRANEAQKTVGHTASLTREIYRDYNRILTELKVNRVKQQKIDDVELEIIKPLGQIVDPSFGNFATAEETLGKFYEDVDADAVILNEADREKTIPAQVLSKLEANRPNLLAGARASREQMDRLVERLKTVLDAMEEGTTYGRLLQVLVSIERDQREIVERFRYFHDAKVREVLEGLTNP